MDPKTDLPREGLTAAQKEFMLRQANAKRVWNRMMTDFALLTQEHRQEIRKHFAMPGGTE